MPTEQPKYRVQSVERAIEILRFLQTDAATDGVPLQALVNHMGMSKSSVFSTLQTLVANDLVTAGSSGNVPRYRLGLGLVRLGRAAAEQTTVAEFCLPDLEWLAAETGLTARVAVPEGPWAVAVARIDAPGQVRLDLRLGEREWPHRSGLGKALMSELANDAIVAYTEQLGMPAHTGKTLTTSTALIEDIERSRLRGYCMDDEEDAEGIICVASPVRDGTAAPFAAIGVTGLKASPALADVEAVAVKVKEAADRLGSRVRGN